MKHHAKILVLIVMAVQLTMGLTEASSTNEIVITSFGDGFLTWSNESDHGK
jgi:hypothetical protein